MFHGIGIDTKMVHAAIRLTHPCHISGIKSYQANKVLVWAEEAQVLNSISWDPALFDGVRVWTHCDEALPPTIGYIAAVPERFGKDTVCDVTGAFNAIRVANGYKLYYNTPADLFVSCLQGAQLDELFRSVTVWIRSDRCIQCGVKGHYAKECNQNVHCALCQTSDHCFKQCNKRIEVTRQERKEISKKQWTLLRSWCENRHPDLRIEPEEDNTVNVPWIQVTRSSRNTTNHSKARRTSTRTRDRRNNSYANVTRRGRSVRSYVNLSNSRIENLKILSWKQKKNQVILRLLKTL